MFDGAARTYKLDEIGTAWGLDNGGQHAIVRLVVALAGTWGDLGLIYAAHVEKGDLQPIGTDCSRPRRNAGRAAPDAAVAPYPGL